MRTRYINSLIRNTERYPADITASMALVSGILLFLSTFTSSAPLSAYGWTAGAFTVLGLIGITTGRLFEGRPWVSLLTHGGIALTLGAGLFALTSAPIWWMTLVTLALLFAFLAVQVFGVRHAALYSGIPIIGAVSGMLVSPGNLPEPVLVLGLLIGGTLAVLMVLPTLIVPSTGKQNASLVMESHSQSSAMQIRVTADGLGRATEALNSVTVQQSTGANEQARAITEANLQLEDFIELSERVREQARSITDLAETSAAKSQSGREAIGQAIRGMSEIRAQVSAIGSTIYTLAQLTQRIDEIITSVSEIAAQSNLLALNASIEAARAGTHGRGFAVVASEVRSLAQQSKLAAVQVRAILNEIQAAMKETVSAAEVGAQGVDAGVAMTQEAGQIMAQLAESVNSSNEAVRAIHDTIRQQVDGLEQIAISMDNIERVTQQSMASTRMAETVSINLNHLAAELQQVVEEQAAGEPNASIETG